jgi:hypothetical protein
LCLLNSKRKFIQSPDGKKCITFFRPVSLFWDNTFYVIPYKYKGHLAPSTNYVIIKPKGLNDFVVNWKPTKTYTLKMAFESGFVVNKFDSSVFFATNYNDYLDSGETYLYPKYEGFFLNDIINKK